MRPPAESTTQDAVREQYQQIRILVVEEDIFCRDAIREALNNAPDTHVCGSCQRGLSGLQLAIQTKPEVILLSASLPDISPADFIMELRSTVPEAAVIVVAEENPATVRRTIEALEAGAFDLITKSASACRQRPLGRRLRASLLPKVRCCSVQRYSRLAKIRIAGGGAGAADDSGSGIYAILPDRMAANVERLRAEHTFGVVLIGGSTGGPEALTEIMKKFPANFPVPIMCLLHMPPLFTEYMATTLNKFSKLTVRLAHEGDELKPGQALLAPGGRDAELVSSSTGKLCFHTAEEVRTDAVPCPSLDVLFLSATRVCKRRVIAVILTGMGNDGARGMKALKDKGAITLVQDRDTSVVWGMPGSAVQQGAVDEILPLRKIARRLTEIVGRPK